jgi:hypothetical protein
MTERFAAILLSLLVALQSVAGMPAGVIVCLGGGHAEHDHEPAPCASSCEHEPVYALLHTGWPERDHHCGCVDIELATHETLPAPQNESSAGAHVCPVGSSAIPPMVSLASCGPRAPPAAWDDPGGRDRLRLVRSTRLII